MSFEDSFSLSFKRKSGKWGWSLSVCGLRLEVDFYRAQELALQLNQDYPVVCIYNNSKGHLSEIYINGSCEILRKESDNYYAKFK